MLKSVLPPGIHDDSLKISIAIISVLISCCTGDEQVPGDRVRVQDPAGHKYELTIYEDANRKGISATFADFSDWFDDLDYVLENFEMKKLGWICVEAGIFIFFKERDYESQNQDTVHVLSGNGVCTAPPPQGVLSIRRASSKSGFDEATSHITTFMEINYGGIIAFTLFTKSAKNLKGYQPTKSLIIVGSARWLMETELGDFHCLVPFLAPEDPEIGSPTLKLNVTYVCLVPDTKGIFDKGNGVMDLRMKRITKNCRNANGATVTEHRIDTCFDYASGEMKDAAVNPLALPPPPEPPAPSTTDPGVEASPFHGLKCGTYDEIALLIRLRIINDFTGTHQFLLPLDKLHIWRTELIDVTFEVIARLLNTLVSDEFLGSMREYFIYFSEKNVWSAGQGWPEDKPDKDVLTILHLTRQCFDKLPGWKLLPEIQKTVSDILTEGAIANQSEIIKKELLMKPTPYDPLVEFVWLAVNLAGVSCHQVLGFNNNFWLDFLTVASDMYLKPMVDYWRFDSEDEQKYYPIIFGGYNITREYEAGAVFTTAVYDLVKYSEVWPRPEELKAIGRSSSKSAVVAASTNSSGNGAATSGSGRK